MRTLIFILLLSPLFSLAQKTDVFIKLTDARGQQIKGEATTKGFEKWNSANQKKIMIYNNGISQSIDLVNGNLISHPDSVQKKKGHFYFFEGQRILVIDSSVTFRSAQKLVIDLLVISKNAKISIEKLASVFDINEIVFDASNSLWKIDKWKKDCEKLHLRCHFVSEQGAFVTDLQQ